MFFSRFVKEKRALRTHYAFCRLFVSSRQRIWIMERLKSEYSSHLLYSVRSVLFVVFHIAARTSAGLFCNGVHSVRSGQTLQYVQVRKMDISPHRSCRTLLHSGSFLLRQIRKKGDWDTVLLFSGLGLGVITSFNAPFEGGSSVSIPVAIAATLFAVEAFARRSAWWALPANALYLMSYFMILAELNVDEPQYYSISAALLGMLMHYLLTVVGSKTGAFIMGILSQVVLLGTTYIQMVSANKISFFFVLFVQSMVVLIYELIQRSRRSCHYTDRVRRVGRSDCRV